MSAEVTSCNAWPACTAEVLRARTPGGGTILLNPNTYKAGKYGLSGDGRARLLTPTDPLREDETRHSAHTCKKLAPVRQAQSANAAAGRIRSHQYAPKDRNPFAGAVLAPRVRPGESR